jgi:hypothetical protein
MRQKVRPPAEFADVFKRGGYRLVEHVFGSRTSVNILFREMCGGSDLIAERKEMRRKM